LNIFITNDDGIYAPGIKILCKLLSYLGYISIIAPDCNQSGSSCSISLKKNLHVIQIKKNWWKLNGKPVDCVKLGLSGFIHKKPDIVISGINNGANLGDDIIYSGTVGAAIEGRFLKFPSIAVSCVNNKDTFSYYETAAKVICKILNYICYFPKYSKIVLNVNVPNLPFSKIKGIQATIHGDRFFAKPIKLSKNKFKKYYYSLGRPGKIRNKEKGTDFYAIKKKYVSITPIYTNFPIQKNKIYSIQNWINKII